MSVCVIDGKQCQCDPGHGEPCEAAEALRKDAERYRWLRHGDNDERGAVQRPGVLTYLLRNEELDACCDAGLRADAEEDAHTVVAPDVGAA
jgi:hypothetical protein